MIAKPQLKKLVHRYVLDARVLLNNRRYASARYLCGYAIELGFKYRICKIFKFTDGYPENSTEFDDYVLRSKKTLGKYIKDIRNLKIHDLSKLKEYSGQGLTIDEDLAAQWDTVRHWTVLSRYDDGVVRKKKAAEFYEATSAILTVLI